MARTVSANVAEIPQTPIVETLICDVGVQFIQWY